MCGLSAGRISTTKILINSLLVDISHLVVQCRFLPLQAGKNLRGAAAYNYIMKPTANGALIMEATVTEVHQFSPFNEMTGAAQMEAK